MSSELIRPVSFDPFDLDYWRQFDINEDKVIEYLEFIKSVDITGRESEFNRFEYEYHHIVPKCVDFDYLNVNTSDIVPIRARDHFIAHMILPECFNRDIKHKMSYAAHLMSVSNKGNRYKVSSEEYEFANYLIRKAISEYRKTCVGSKNSFYGKHHTYETKKILSEKNSNPSPETRAKQSKAHKGFKWRDESKAKLSKSMKGRFVGSLNPMYGKYKELNPFFGCHHTQETKDRISKDRIERGLSKGENNPMYGAKGDLAPASHMKWVNNGKNSEYINEDLVDDYINNRGYVEGRLQPTGYKYVNKDGKNYRIPKEEFNYYLSIGYGSGYAKTNRGDK